MKNFHVPLPDETYDRFRISVDLDDDLEAAGIEHLVRTP